MKTIFVMVLIIMIFNKKSKMPYIEYYVSGNLYCANLHVGRKIFSKALKAVLYKDENYIYLSDIYVANDNQDYLKYINKGYGSILLSNLIKYAKQNKYRKIVGFLSDADIIPEDKNHKKRQISFYKKFGFNISNSDKTTIELIL